MHCRGLTCYTRMNRAGTRVLWEKVRFHLWRRTLIGYNAGLSVDCSAISGKREAPVKGSSWPAQAPSEEDTGMHNETPGRARFLLLVMCFTTSAYGQATWYVDDDAPFSGDGTNWATAFKHLQDALAVAVSGDEIRVAAGTYKPDEDEAGNVTPGDREATFQLVNAVSLKGGYAGLTNPDEPDDRKIELYETVLSGDLAGNDRAGFVEYEGNSYHVITVSETDDTTVLDGFTVRAGNANGICDYDFVLPCAGGGLCHDNGDLAVRSCTFTENMATRGGGLYTEDGRLDLYRCTFANNSAVYGGGMRNNRSLLTLTACAFINNEAPWGGGFINEDSPQTTMIGCTFDSNTATGFALGGGMRNWTSNLMAIDCKFIGNSASGTTANGGGLFNCGNDIGKTLTLIACEFADNTAKVGGGLWSGPALEGVDTLINCTFRNNTASEIGGGIYRSGPTSAFLANSTFLGNSAGDRGGGMWNSRGSNASLINCAFSGNTAALHGGGMSSQDASPLAVNCTFSGNWAGLNGGGLYNTHDSNPTLINCVLWSNSDGGGLDELAQIHMEGGAPIIHHTCLQGWTGLLGGSGNTGNDPLLVDADGNDDIPGTLDDDLRLSAASPAIDAGIGLALADDRMDLDGDGDTGELTPLDLAGLPRFIDIVAAPDTGAGPAPVVDMGAYEHAVDCNSNGIPDDLDIAGESSLDCDRNGIPDECQVSPDCNGNGTCDGQDIAGGTSQDCNGNGVPDECGEDCNGNGFADTCDIASGSSDDCNNDGIPDECLTRAIDCNANGLVDECETADGLSPDDNSNGVPDECEPPVLYVDHTATGIANGTGWTDAFDDLQDALAVAERSAGLVNEIWVAAGVYTPDRATGNRLESFHLVNGIALLGGFAGYETARDQRDFVANETILSGDLVGNDMGGLGDLSRVDNAYHVVIAKEVGETTVLDGFTVAWGHATPLSPVDRDRGGGMWNNGTPIIKNVTFHRNWAVGEGGGLYNNGDPTLSNCVFDENASDDWGGGMFNDGIRSPVPASPLISRCRFTGNTGNRGGGLALTWADTEPWLVDCKFLGNTARVYGGGLYNDNNAHPRLINCTFSGNATLSDRAGGGGMANFNSDATLVNCTFAGNTAANPDSPGGMMADTSYGGTTTLTNCIFWGNSNAQGVDESAQLSVGYFGTVAINSTCIQGLTGAFGGVGNIGDDPRFMDADGADDLPGTEDDNLRLLQGSRCIDAGDNTAVTISGDLDGFLRFVNDPRTQDTGNGMPPIVDMGAYEFRPGDCGHDGDVDHHDLADFNACLLGPTDEPPLACECFDLDGDGRVDLGDFATFQVAFTGQR